MTKYTLVNLATILGLGNEFQEELKSKYPSYSEDEKYETAKILWDNFNILKSRLAELKYQQFMTEVDEGKRELTTDMYSQAIKAVWQDFDDILLGKIKDKEQIEKLRQEIHTSLGDQVIS